MARQYYLSTYVLRPVHFGSVVTKKVKVRLGACTDFKNALTLRQQAAMSGDKFAFIEVV